MAILTIKLIKKEEVAEGTMAFHFEKPQDFEFMAGQNGDFTLLNPTETDDEGNKRTFSFVSAPFEKDLVIATRMRDSAFKRVLKNLSPGSEMQMDGPYGDFVLHKKATTPAVFLTGGIGVTTVRSIIAQASRDELPHNITLLYSNKTPKDTAYLSNLQSFVTENPNFNFVPVMTRATTDDWSGESGHVTREMLSEYVKDLTTPIYYLSGPASMVKAMRQILTDAQVNEDNIRTEEYSGY